MQLNWNVYVRHLRVEHRHPALGIEVACPRLSWQIVAPDDWQQVSYEVEIRRGEEVEVFGPLTGSENVFVPWPAKPLAPRDSVMVRVRVRGEDGNPSAWADNVVAERGLDVTDWLARPIGAAWPENPESDRRPSLVRKCFHIRPHLVSARCYATAHGIYSLELNGENVGSDILAPGWSPYGKRLRYQTYDVTTLLKPGPNAIGAWLGDGWYRGRLGFRGGNRNLYGSDLSLMLQLELTYADGSRDIIATDETWRAAPSPIEFSSLYDGETFDARQHDPKWSCSDFADDHWASVKTEIRDPQTLAAPDGPPIRRQLTLEPVAIDRKAPDRMVVDFGQNLVGRIEFEGRGAAGERLQTRHAEVMQDGELYMRPLRFARATDTYVFSGAEIECWEPKFTYHGFRYAELSAPPAVLDGIKIKAHVYHSDMERTGWFECSDPLLNRLHENVVWSMRGNFVDVPTDCPQRDERLGWTGDIQIFAPVANFLFDTTGMLSSWLRDLSLEQGKDGTVPWFVPVIPGSELWTPARPGAAWGDAAVLVPWSIWVAKGDRQILERQWPSAKAWVDLLARRAGDTFLWRGDFQLGDWLDPSAPPDRPAEAMTDRDLVASAYFSWSARHLGKIAEVLGRTDDSLHYQGIAESAAAAIRQTYLDEKGRLRNETQTGYSLLITFNLLDRQDLIDLAGERLRELVISGGYRIATGFVGTPLILHALTATGSLDIAYRQLMERGCPSWLYAVDQGATTIWERWDSQLEDGRINPGQMTSFNHYALGAVADWMHGVIAGLSPAEPGYRKILFAPRPGGGLSWAKAEHVSPYGRIGIHWKLHEGVLTVHTRVPTGSTADLRLPDGTTHNLSAGEHRMIVRIEPAQQSDTSRELPAEEAEAVEAAE